MTDLLSRLDLGISVGIAAAGAPYATRIGIAGAPAPAHRIRYHAPTPHAAGALMGALEGALAGADLARDHAAECPTFCGRAEMYTGDAGIVYVIHHAGAFVEIYDLEF